jgi:hypothetical protein
MDCNYRCGDCVHGTCVNGVGGTCSCAQGWIGPTCNQTTSTGGVTPGPSTQNDTCLYSIDGYQSAKVGYRMEAFAQPDWKTGCTAMDGAVLRVGWEVPLAPDEVVCCVQRGIYDAAEQECRAGCVVAMDYVYFGDKCFSRCFDTVTGVCVSELQAFSTGRVAVPSTSSSP